MPTASEVGQHYSLDPVDSTGTMFRVSVYACDTLERTVEMLRERHGWLVASEMPRIVYAGDLIEVEHPQRGPQGTCVRPVLLEVTYSAVDPESALHLVVDSWNATDPPYRAQAGWCGSTLCVLPTERRGVDGVWEAVVRVLDQPVSFAPGPKSPWHLLDGLQTQLDRATDDAVYVHPTQSELTMWDEETTSSAYEGVPARQVLVDLTAVRTQRDFAERWAFLHALREEERLSQRMGPSLDAAYASAVARGLTDAEWKAEWEVIGRQVAAGFVPEPVPPTPAFTPGLGPGWTWQVLVDHNVGGRTWVRILQVGFPGAWGWEQPLPATTPVPEGQGRAAGAR